jgi:diamine N-acetyltransferase
MAEAGDGEHGDLFAHGRDGATEAIGAWADSRLAAGEAAPDRDPRPAPEATVELREVTADTVRAVCLLHVAPDQRGFVAPNAVSFAEAMFEPKAWFRAVVADDIPVGFVMLSVDKAAPEYYLWRFMIDQRYQGCGYGRAAILLVIEHVRALPNATELLVSWVPEPGGPAPFYEGLGFEPTGEVDGDEVVARLRL